MKSKKKINWKQTWQNNLYMLGFIHKAAPGLIAMQLTSWGLNALRYFFMQIFLFNYVLNALQTGETLSTMLLTVGAVCMIALLSVVFRQIELRYTSLKTPKVDAYIQNLLQEKAIAVELGCFERAEFYDNYVKATGEAASRVWQVLSNVCEVLWMVITIGTGGTLIFSIHPSFLALACLPLIYTLLFGNKRNQLRYEKEMQRKEVERQKDYVRRTFYLKDFSKEMRLTQMWQVMMKRMQSSVVQLKELVDKYGYTLLTLRYILEFISDIIVYYGAILLAAFKTLVTRDILLGDCFAIINSIENISFSINQVGNVFVKLSEDSLYIDNLRAFLNYDIQITEDENAPEAPSMETLELKNVGFCYEDQKEPALKEISFTVRKGERIAIVGHNGAGKTTLIKLLLRLYDVTEGEILYNGQNIRNFRLSSYRNLFGTVFQDYRLFATTIAENVLLRRVKGDEDKELVAYALQHSGLTSRIQALPKDMDTNVTREFDKEGAIFSGGEAQKLSIARIFAGDHEIVMLDEPTSALDPIAEQEMYHHMFEACSGKTVIFISHRLSSATMADKVYLFENGRIAEEGTHRELLLKNGKYADMWHKQADSYANSDVEEVEA